MEAWQFCMIISLSIDYAQSLERCIFLKNRKIVIDGPLELGFARPARFIARGVLIAFHERSQHSALR